MSGLDIFLGDPIYDDQNRVVRREFGLKNVIAIAIVLYVGNLLMGQMEPKSGKMKGGGQKGGGWWSGLAWVALVVAIIAGLLSWAKKPGLSVPRSGATFQYN